MEKMECLSAQMWVGQFFSTHFTVHLSLAMKPSLKVEQYPPHPAPPFYTVYHCISAHIPFREVINGKEYGRGSLKTASPPYITLHTVRFLDSDVHAFVLTKNYFNFRNNHTHWGPCLSWTAFGGSHVHHCMSRVESNLTVGWRLYSHKLRYCFKNIGTREVIQQSLQNTALLECDVCSTCTVSHSEKLLLMCVIAMISSNKCCKSCKSQLWLCNRP